MRNRTPDEQPRERGSDERRTPKVWRTRALAEQEPVERDGGGDRDVAKLREKAHEEISAATERLRTLPAPGAFRLDDPGDAEEHRGAPSRDDRGQPPAEDVRRGVERVGEPGMSQAPRSRLVPVGVEPLDEASRHFVPRALPERDVDDDRTGRG